MRVVRGTVAGVLVTAVLWATACQERKTETADVSGPATGTTDAPAASGPSIAYTSDPNPPHAGDNAVSVVVRDANGAPVADLAVTATYFMPAMPTMNMPEMRDSFPLVHQADGRYAGNVRLSMGGTWMVTITATRSGETVARQSFNIIAKE